MSDNPELKMAENDDHAFWIEMKEKAERAIKSSEREIILQEGVIRTCKQMIKTFKH